MGLTRSEFLEEPGTIIPLPSGIIFEDYIFQNYSIVHSMPALKTKLFYSNQIKLLGSLRIGLSPSNLEPISHLLILDFTIIDQFGFIQDTL